MDVSTLGPGPYASMILADFGADVIEIRRPSANPVDGSDNFVRGKRMIYVDLRAEGGSELISRLCDSADVFLESYRPGTMERRGLGPELLMARNPRLIYTRLTGWGQTGPYATGAGHDINYVAIAGALGAVGFDEPVPALNLLGDFMGGSMPAVLGILMALFERERSGLGQVVDAAMVDGSAYALFAQFADLNAGRWQGRGKGMIAGRAPFYSVYGCSDGGWVSVGAIENKFFRELLAALGLDSGLAETQYDEALWPEVRQVLADCFAKQPRDHWAALFDGTDACVRPVLEMAEVAGDAHIAARGTVRMDEAGEAVVAPAPRLSASPGAVGPVSALSRTNQLDLLRARGIVDADIERFVASGALSFGVRE